MRRFTESLGKQILFACEQTGQVMLLFYDSLRHLVGLLSCLLQRSQCPGQRYGLRLIIYQMAHLGVNSLPIVSLTVLFTGMVMTMQSAYEFVKYGAGSSVGGVVALVMSRELSPVLTGVVVAGRVGAAITAEIGSMKVTEQIDALRVMAVNPVRYLVVPRLVACALMMPLLVVYSNIIGTIGGYMVAVYTTDISSYTYLTSIKTFMHVYDIIAGLVKAVFFGAIIAIIGCYKGFGAQQGAEGVGKATTGSVVTSIVMIFICNYFLSALLFSK